ncbi:4'-phosphopantetheine phosphatase [Tribolium madens]|uniref:4'-phosphopantetheine phosphatase n=1 Tax=Tribolium madens TaxID=41895 RepID=UPI001CF735B3|nr:4'-phosphopantetheine phosphatase [Tribolium madens]
MEQSVCPLLKDPKSYNPDTIDLINDIKERKYWLPCLENMVKKFVAKASSLNPDNPNATENAEICFQKFHDLVIKALEEPSVLAPLSIRTLLEFNEDNLRSNSFKDAWYKQKETETKAALKEFKERLDFIDSIADFESKWLEIVTGVLAGNVFDWGSTIVADILETSTNFGLSQAMSTIEKRPWFKDNLDNWIERIKKEPYKEAVVFVDNAGVDFVLGILPLIREFLKQNTKVIVTANTAPALNDVTWHELKLYSQEAASQCPILEQSLRTGQLVTVENGQKGPCLDLSTLSPELCRLMSGADLIILEGMGRAVHTNLYAKFNVDSVKLAVLKNDWLAKGLGAQQFSVIFNYETAT